MAGNYFYEMIKTLRLDEDVILHINILNIENEERERVIQFLSEEYKKESYCYPYHAPKFSPEAALWAAEIIYITAQLILFRKHEISELKHLFPDFISEMNPSKILSADLCLRFMPNMIKHMKIIDNDDALISLLEDLLIKWHYSGVNYPLKVEEIDFEIIFSDSCLQQLYLNRVIEFQNLNIAKDERVYTQIKACLGIYGNEFWKDF